MKNLKDHKVFFLPANTGYNKNGAPDERLINFHNERSGKGIYCSIVGNVVLPGGYGSNNYCTYISEDPNWDILTTLIEKNGSVPGIQLSSAWPNYQGNRSFVSCSQDILQYYQDVAYNISKDQINKIFDTLKQGVNIAINKGFRHIQIHAAHGYLISLLIDSIFCENYRYSLECLTSLILSIDNKIEVSIRISCLIGIQLVDKKRDDTLKRIFDLPADYFDLSFGFYNINKNMIYPETRSMLHSRLKKSLELIDKYPLKSFIISGRSLSWYNDTLPRNAHLGICRDLIANPNFLIDTTLHCNQCKECHYYSKGEQFIKCSQWM